VSSLLLLSCCSSDLVQIQQSSQILSKSFVFSRKWKREQEEQEAENLSSWIWDQSSSKRLLISSSSCTAEIELKEKKKKRASDIKNKNIDSLEYWILIKRWFKKYFEQDSQIREDFEQSSWLKEQMENSTQTVKYVKMNDFRLSCFIRKVSISLSWKQSNSSLNDFSNQKNWEKKSASYRTARYITLLESKESYMKKFKLDVTETSLARCKTFLNSEQTVSKDSLFQDNLFQATCDKVQNRNETRVIRSIISYIVLSAENLKTLDATHLEHLIERVNECWTDNIAVKSSLSRSNYSVEFRRSAFIDEQLKKLDSLIDSVFENFLFVAIYRMYFSFFTCEMKCDVATLDIVDHQNAHSMIVVVRALVQLYKAVKREKELHQKILAFSILHDHRSMRIYDHYTIIEKDKTIFYRHFIHTFDFIALNEKNKWTTYKFTKNVYNTWMSIHHKRICSAIDDLSPDIDFSLSQSASFSQSES